MLPFETAENQKFFDVLGGSKGNIGNKKINWFSEKYSRGFLSNFYNRVGP